MLRITKGNQLIELNENEKYLDAVQNDPTGEERTEDEIIAWTWRSYVTDYTDTPEVIARMPMTKVSEAKLRRPFAGLSTVQSRCTPASFGLCSYTLNVFI